MVDRFLIWIVGAKNYQKGAISVFGKIALILNVMTFLVSLLYIVIDTINGFYAPLLPLGIINIGSLLGIILARFGKVTLARITVIFLTNISLFILTCADDSSTGSHLYYITLSLASFTVLGFKQLRISILLALLSFVLHQISFLTDFTVIPKFVFTAEEIRARFIFNSSIFITVTMGIFILYMRMMHRQQFIIKAKNKLLKSTNIELDHFLYSTSHDLRSPLASLQGLLSIASSTTDQKELKHLHGMMDEQVHKMDDFIKDIINIMRNSRQPIKKEEFNLNQFFDDVLAENKYNYTSGDVEIINNIPKSVYMITDMMRLKTVIGNLCSNAIKYADQGKANKYVEVNCEITDEFIVLEVGDNGIGIDPAYKEKVFDMFYRATEESKGTGLGLYIARETIANLGGSITLESTLGKGTNFKVSLPKNVLGTEHRSELSDKIAVLGHNILTTQNQN